MKAYLTLTTILITGTYLAGYAHDTSETIAKRCYDSAGRRIVMIDGERFYCWRMGEYYLQDEYEVPEYTFVDHLRERL